MTLNNNRAPLLSNIKLYASFHHHIWIETGVTVRKRLSWVMTSVSLTFDLWPWPFAWTSILSLVITPENFVRMRWPEHSQKDVTDRQTDGRTDRRTERSVLRAAWSQLKKKKKKDTGCSWKATLGLLSLPLWECRFPLDAFSNHGNRDLWPRQKGPGQTGPVGYPSTSFLCFWYYHFF